MTTAFTKNVSNGLSINKNPKESRILHSIKFTKYIFLNATYQFQRDMVLFIYFPKIMLKVMKNTKHLTKIHLNTEQRIYNI
jgi:hypothetical protein